MTHVPAGMNFPLYTSSAVVLCVTPVPILSAAHLVHNKRTQRTGRMPSEKKIAPSSTWKLCERYSRDTVPFRPYRMSRVTGPSPSNVKRNVSHVTRPSSGCDTVNCIFDFFGPAAHCSTQYVYQTLLEIARRATMGEGTRRGCL